MIQLDVIGDSTPGPNEPFSVGLSNPRGGVTGVSTGQSKILNDDGPFG